MSMLPALIERLQQDAFAHDHRRILVLSGSQAWCYDQVLPYLQKDAVWVGLHGPAGYESYPNQQTHKLLGRTISQLVYDAWSGFNPNSFGQVTGTLTGGGVLFFLCPDLDEWAEFDDPEYLNLVAFPFTTQDAGRRFISRAALLLEDDAYTLIYREKAELSGVEFELPDIVDSSDEVSDEIVLPCKTQDQQLAVELVLKQFRRGRRPVVLTADRGRGKSVALGIAAAQLSGLDCTDILITAPDYASAEQAFLMAHQLLPDYEYGPGKLIKGKHSIRFVEPELACNGSGEGKVLFVDEAAAIPVPVLRQCLEHFPRVAFASTVHGYEGNGQGFSIRFRQVLQDLTPNWKSIHLKQPIRWKENDPLEALVFDLLLLNAEAASIDEKIEYEQLSISIVKLDRDQLSEDYETLNQLFGLLVLAHYRTSPGDLRILLDSPGLHIWVLRIGGQVAGALLVAEEGPLDADLVDDIWSGKRRPRGHLLPQTLVAQEGVKKAASLKAGRVIRIAVHPHLHGKGLGSQLLQSVETYAKAQCWDYLGSSYAVNANLVKFWQQNHWETLRLGSSKDSVSGSYAALVMKPISEKAVQLAAELKVRFKEQLNYRLGDDLQSLDIEVVCGLLTKRDRSNELAEHERADLMAFMQHNRSYESCSLSINKFLRCFLSVVERRQFIELLENKEVVLLLKKSLQQYRWQDLGQDGLGRKGLMRQLRNALSLLVKLYQAH